MELINDFKSKAQQATKDGYRVRIEHYFSRGIGIFRKKMDFFILYTLIYFVCGSIPFVNFLLSLTLLAGFFISAHYLDNGRTLHFEDMFDGFKYFSQLLLLTIIAGFFVFIGMIALLIPGIYLSVGYTFSPLFVIFGRMDFWESMVSSRRLVHREWFSIFGLLLLLGLFNLLGLLALGVGILLTFPISCCVVYAAFDDIIGVEKVPSIQIVK